MSVHAEACPHCGETAFFIRRTHVVQDESPCTGGAGGKWMRCCGRGWYYGRFAGITLCQYEFEGEDDTGKLRLKDGQRYYFSPELLGRRGVAEALRSGDYAVENEGNAANQFWTFYYERVVCPECGGRGVKPVSRTRYSWEDIRRPVK